MDKHYINFEFAKKLKEKGYPQDDFNTSWFNRVGLENGVVNINEQGQKVHYGWHSYQANDSIKVSKEVFDECCSHKYTRPEQWEVIDWLFKEYKYSIEAEMNIPESGPNDGCYVFNGVIKGSDNYKLKIFHKTSDQPTREKALNEAFDWVITNNFI